MSFDKYYPKRKDWRQPYRHSKRFDRSCRPGENCGYCKGNRLYSSRKKIIRVKNEISEFLKEKLV